MFMEAPDNDITLQGLTGHTPYTGDVVTSTGDDDVLQGSMGSLTAPGNVSGNSHTGIVGNDSLTDTTGGVGLATGSSAKVARTRSTSAVVATRCSSCSCHVDFTDHAQTITNSN